jgi:hypothetical protein
MERVHHRRAKRGPERDGGRVEGMIVDDVVPDPPHLRINAGERRLGRCQIGRARSGRPVERGGERLRVDAGVDHLGPRYLRSGGGVDVDAVPPADQAARQVGHECLRAAALWLADGRHQRRDDRDLHRGTLLKARSRGGLIPRMS